MADAPEKDRKAEKPGKPEKDAKPGKPDADAKAAAPAAEGAAAATETAEDAAKKVKKAKKFVGKAVAHVFATFNNTVITITDTHGAAVCSSSSGSVGYKGSRKSTPYAAQKAGEQVAEKARRLGVREIDVKVKGPGAGRESAIRALQAGGLDIKSIEDVTPIPHNGCRAPKRRRV